MTNPCGNDKCNEINAGIDECIKPLVKALNEAGLETIASCCGHGNRPGNITLRGGREIIIMPDFETARSIDHLFPDIHNTPKLRPATRRITEISENARIEMDGIVAELIKAHGTKKKAIKYALRRKNQWSEAFPDNDYWHRVEAHLSS